MHMYFTGLIIGIATFLIIGIFHPLVIKGEYWFGVRIWWIFALSGAVTLAASLLTENVMVSTLLAVWSRRRSGRSASCSSSARG